MLQIVDEAEGITNFVETDKFLGELQYAPSSIKGLYLLRVISLLFHPNKNSIYLFEYRSLISKELRRFE